MSRREERFTASAGRDAGKVFLLKEMPADQAEWWAIRVGRALAIAGVNLPEDWENASMAQMAALGFTGLAGMPELTLKSLLAEMYDCVRYQPKGKGAPPQVIFEGEGCQIEEVATFFAIRKALWFLHTGFSPAVDTPTSE